MKDIVILGSTGSIGTQTLDVVRHNRDRFRVVGLTCRSHSDLMMSQAREFGVPEKNCFVTSGTPEETAKKLIEAATLPCDLVVNALMGMRGLEPTYHALMNGTDVALANKETLVAGGSVIMDLVKKTGLKLLPIDSEHSAIFQCLEGNRDRKVKKILLTCSGGPFRGRKRPELETVTREDALKHPRWDMGAKITIDSATLMNKGLEVIEAKWLFDVKPENIQVLVHPQSIVHSGVEFMDNSVLCQLGVPDMRIPISLALGYPERLDNPDRELDFFGEGSHLTFEKPDLETFKCLRLAFFAAEKGGSSPVVMNAANEVLVQRFLEGRVGFLEMQDKLWDTVMNHETVKDLSLDDILRIDKETRQRV